VTSVRTADVTESRVINALATHVALTEELPNVHILKDGYHFGELTFWHRSLTFKF
jgi:hypothetical protein